MTRKPHFLVPLLLLVGCSQLVSAQPAWTIDLLNKTEQKPEKFENRKLGSERLAEKKFTIVRRFFQNTYTHYNYFFNASNKIAMVIERAKAEQRNDFSKMLPFYPYSLEQTKAQAIELDSVIFKSTAGILLHDLRSNWVDNMYLLMGQAYFLRKDFDSAVATFQFINYNLYPRKKGDDDDQVVGTNYNAKNQQVSIANSEKRNIVNRLTSRPPSRNDALLWLARTLIEQDEMGEAIGLINTLQQDPNLPKRLKNDLDEIHAYWFYRQGMFDSSANYLAKALGNSATKQDRSRSEFLLGQLYAMQGNYDLATAFYEKASKHTVDPLLDIYARLNSATLLKGTNPKEMDKSIDNLVKMARRDKFENYRHILYFAAGEIALEKPDTSNAIKLYNRSLKYNTDQAVYKNKALLKLADIYYDQKQYKLSFAAYDSLASDDTTLTAQLASIQSRRNALSNLVQKLAVIEREDSLQRIAALPTNEREAFVRKLSRKLRKERGLTAEEPSAGQSDMLPIGGSRDTQASSDLFSSSSKGEWYFYNTSLRTKGFNEFKRRWGTRTNTDNWRRKSATDAAIKDNKPPAAAPGAPDMGVGSPDDAGPVMSDNPDAPTSTAPKKVNKAAISNEPAQPEDLSFEGMMANLPLTPERKTESDQRIAINLFESGKVYQFELTDYEEAIGAYETSLQRFPDSLYNGELLLNLYTCYKKLGRNSEANRYKQQLTQSFPGSKAERMANQPESLKAGAGNEAGTKAYESIYTLFIEGKFDEALQQKKIADSLYGNNFWSPQLLYIEAVYHIRQRNDSIAIHTLRQLISLYPQAKMVNKAERLIEVLGRRAEIEKRLSELEVTRAKEDDPIVITPTPPTRAQQKPIVADSLAQKQPQLGDPPQPQATANPDAPAPKPAVVSGPFVYAEGQHLVLMVLDKVDGTYINEAKNAYTRFSSDYFRDLQLEITRETLDAERALVVFKTFPDTETAMRFIARARRAAPEEVAWLPANKYSFVLISESNLTLLQSNKNLAGYLDGLRKQFPGQF